jgi:MIP family channel proteins
MSNSLTKALVAEAIGTFALVFIGAGAGAVSGDLVAVAFAHGLVVLAFAYAYGHISGAHVNPAVTCGVLAAGKMEPARALGYIAAQIVGGLLGAFTLRWVLNGTTSSLGELKLAATVTPGVGAFVEAILAFFLINTVLNAAVSGRAGNLAGVAIGMTLTLNILMGGPLTGAGFNPARYLGPAVVLGDLSQAWIYILGPIVGAVVAGLLYRGFFAES